MKKITLALLTLSLLGCLGKPDTIQPVKPFALERYLGRWYEIARLDHSFERGLDHVNAEYTLKDNGTVRVVNRGYDPVKKAWKAAEGKAQFVGNQNEGYLKVSFFGPFYGSYVIFGLDQQNYQYSFVSGPDTSYLWLLARTPTVSDAVMQQFITEAKTAGFDTSKLILVDQRMTTEH
ncbi:MAG TPA: lipocalin family protein [Pseudomonadales bacterium]|nr:lipocalin family protein [Pseudomonadales bacterium]